jgi:acetoin utilization deacetylase AcuC-like enzyme
VKVVFHQKFHQKYTGDPAAADGRLEPAEEKLKGIYEFAEAEPIAVADVTRVHDQSHIKDVQRFDRVYKMALLAAGGTLQAARLACSGEPAFALVRPPGHHASPGSCWGFCYFNNIAVAIATLLGEGLVESALILDFDLHYGDGTANTFAGSKQVKYLHPEAASNLEFLANCKSALKEAPGYDMIAVSAGFDRHAQDWGSLLETEDYGTIGRMVKEYAQAHCRGRRFGVLEGGYNHETLADALAALLEGMG